MEEKPMTRLVGFGEKPTEDQAIFVELYCRDKHWDHNNLSVYQMLTVKAAWEKANSQ